MAQEAPENEATTPRWVEVVTAWQSSGLSQADYCKQAGVNPSTLSRWRDRWRDQEAARQGAERALKVRESQPCWIEVAPAVGPESSGHFEVMVRGGRVIRLDSYFDALGLRRLVEVLESLSC
jgi:transposase-like protein